MHACLQEKEATGRLCLYSKSTQETPCDLFKNWKLHRVLEVINTFKFQSRPTILPYNWHKIQAPLLYVGRQTMIITKTTLTGITCVHCSKDFISSLGPDNIPVRQVLLQLSSFHRWRNWCRLTHPMSCS